MKKRAASKASGKASANNARRKAPKRKAAKRKTAGGRTAKAKPLDAPPDPPAGLGEHARDYWQRIAPLLTEAKILTPLHLESFRVLCETWQQYREHSDRLAKLDDWTFSTDRGYVAELPEVRLRQRALDTLTRLWPKFGLTPEALAKINKHGGAPKGKLSPLEQFAAAKYG